MRTICGILCCTFCLICSLSAAEEVSDQPADTTNGSPAPYTQPAPSLADTNETGTFAAPYKKPSAEITSYAPEKTFAAPYKKPPPTLLPEHTAGVFAVPYPPAETPVMDYTQDPPFSVPYKKPETVPLPEPVEDFGIPHTRMIYPSETDAQKDWGKRPFGVPYTVQTDTQRKAQEQGHGL